MEQEHFTQKRKVATTQATNDLTKSVAELLTDVHDESLASHAERSREETLARTTARFAALLAKLSVDGDASSKRNQRVAFISLAIAIIALLISGGQLLVSLRPTPQPQADPAAVDLYQRQVKAAEQQLADTERQMRAAEDILQRQGAVMKRGEQQATQMEALTKQWEQQAARYDAILTRWEPQPAPVPQPPKQQ